MSDAQPAGPTWKSADDLVSEGQDLFVHDIRLTVMLAARGRPTDIQIARALILPVVVERLDSAHRWPDPAGRYDLEIKDTPSWVASGAIHVDWPTWRCAPQTILSSLLSGADLLAALTPLPPPGLVAAVVNGRKACRHLTALLREDEDTDEAEANLLGAIRAWVKACPPSSRPLVIAAAALELGLCRGVVSMGSPWSTDERRTLSAGLLNACYDALAADVPQLGIDVALDAMSGAPLTASYFDTTARGALRLFRLADEAAHDPVAQILGQAFARGSVQDPDAVLPAPHSGLSFP